MMGASGQTGRAWPPPRGGKRLQDPSLPSAHVEGLELFSAQCVCPVPKWSGCMFYFSKLRPFFHVLDGAVYLPKSLGIEVLFS